MCRTPRSRESTSRRTSRREPPYMRRVTDEADRVRNGGKWEMSRYALEFYMSIFPGPGITQVQKMDSCPAGTASLTPVEENEFCLAGTALSGAPEARRREAWFCGRPWRSSNSGVNLNPHPTWTSRCGSSFQSSCEVACSLLTIEIHSFFGHGLVLR